MKIEIVRIMSASLLAVASAALIGCGSTTVANNPLTPSAQAADLRVVSVFDRGIDDEWGVAIGDAQNGDKISVYSYDVEYYAALANRGAEVKLFEVDRSSLHPMQRLNDTTKLYQGIANIDGVRHNVFLVTDDEEEAFFFANIDDDALGALVANGTPMTGRPTGNYDYAGTLYVRENNNVHFGDFDLSADFTNEIFSFLGTARDTSNAVVVTIDGDGVIDRVNGTFGANNVAFTRRTVAGTGNIYGQFHGERARSASGIFHARNAGTTVNYYGGFVGSR